VTAHFYRYEKNSEFPDTFSWKYPQPFWQGKFSVFCKLPLFADTCLANTDSRAPRGLYWSPDISSRNLSHTYIRRLFKGVTGLSWLRIGTGGGLLWMRQWTSGFHKMRGISWLADKPLASQEGLCCMELVSSKGYPGCLGHQNMGQSFGRQTALGGGGGGVNRP
jgi:hypothetical protein